MTKSIVKNKRALSPVIATVILVSVTIVVAVSVAYWMGTLASSYTAFEQIEMPTSYARYTDDVNDNGTAGDMGWHIFIELKNSGSADATINNVFLNAVPLTDYPNVTLSLWNDPNWDTQDPSALAIHVNKGLSAKIRIEIPEGTEGCTSGTRIDLKIHSAAGMDYAVQVKLP